MVEKYLKDHPDFGYSVKSTIIATTDGAYQPALDQALKTMVFQPLDEAIRQSLGQISLAAVLAEAEKQLPPDNLMYFI